MTNDDIRNKRDKLDSEIKHFRYLFQPILGRQKEYDYVNILNVLIQLRRTIQSVDEILGEQENTVLIQRCNRTEGAIDKLEDVLITTEGEFESLRAWRKIMTSYQHVLNGCNAVSKMLSDILQKKKDEQTKEEDSPTGEALALAMLVEHSDWSDTNIAKAVGVNRTTLYDWPNFKKAKEALKQGKKKYPRGSKNGKTGDMEAWESET